MANNKLTALFSRLRHPDVVGILARGTIIALLIQIAGNIIGYAAQIFLARWLGTSGFGTYSYLITWAQVFSIIALLGLDLGIVRFIPEYLLRQDRARLCGILRWSRRLVFSTGVVLAGISTLVLLFLRPIGSEVTTFILCSLLIPLIALTEVQTQIIRSTRRIGWAYTPPILFQPILLLGLIFIILLFLGVLTENYSLFAMMISLLIIIAIQGIVIERCFLGYSKNTIPLYETKGWLAVSLPLLFNSLFSIILLRVDILVVGVYLGPEEVGIYSVAAKTAAIVGITLFAVNSIVAPLITYYYTRRDKASLQNVVSLATAGSFLSSLVIGLGILLFSAPILKVFGVKFFLAQIPLIFLIMGQLVNVGSGSVGLLLVLTGHEKQSMMILGVCALVISLAACIIVPSFGIIGAAIVSMLGISLWNLWMHHLVVKNLGIHPSIFFVIKKAVKIKE